MFVKTENDQASSIMLDFRIRFSQSGIEKQQSDVLIKPPVLHVHQNR